MGEHTTVYECEQCRRSIRRKYANQQIRFLITRAILQYDAVQNTKIVNLPLVCKAFKQSYDILLNGSKVECVLSPFWHFIMRAFVQENPVYVLVNSYVELKPNREYLEWKFKHMMMKACKTLKWKDLCKDVINGFTFKGCFAIKTLQEMRIWSLHNYKEECIRRDSRHERINFYLRYLECPHCEKKGSLQVKLCETSSKNKKRFI